MNRSDIGAKRRLGGEVPGYVQKIEGKKREKGVQHEILGRALRGVNVNEMYRKNPLAERPFDRTFRAQSTGSKSESADHDDAKTRADTCNATKSQFESPTPGLAQRIQTRKLTGDISPSKRGTPAPLSLPKTLKPLQKGRSITKDPTPPPLLEPMCVFQKLARPRASLSPNAPPTLAN